MLFSGRLLVKSVKTGSSGRRLRSVGRLQKAGRQLPGAVGRPAGSCCAQSRGLFRGIFRVEIIHSDSCNKGLFQLKRHTEAPGAGARKRFLIISRTKNFLRRTARQRKHLSGVPEKVTCKKERRLAVNIGRTFPNNNGKFPIFF